MSESKEGAISCSQCGAPDLEHTSEGSLRCPFCGSVYSFKTKGPTVVIRKGANVVFGKNANVIINGGLEIEDGADVRVEGKITLVERASEEAITAARIRLRSGEK